MTCLDWVMKYSEEKRMIPETAEGMMYQRLVQLMADGSFDLVHATEEDWKKLLTDNQSLRPSYRKRARSMLRLLLLYLERHGVDCADSLDALIDLDLGVEASWTFNHSCFFQNLDSLLNVVDELTIDRYNTYGKWHSLVALMILLWAGVPLDDALRVRKKEVSSDDGILYIKVHGQTIELHNRRGAEIIMAYAETNGFEEALTGKFRTYAPTPILIRSGQRTMTKAVAQVNFSNFSTFAQQNGLPYRFRASTIYLNGAFCCALEEAKKNNIPIEPILSREYSAMFARWLREPTLQTGTASLKDHYEMFYQWKTCFNC